MPGPRPGSARPRRRPAAPRPLAGLSPGLPERAHRHPDRQAPGYGNPGITSTVGEPTPHPLQGGQGFGGGAVVTRVLLPREGLSPRRVAAHGPRAAPLGVVLGWPSPDSSGVTPHRPSLSPPAVPKSGALSLCLPPLPGSRLSASIAGQPEGGSNPLLVSPHTHPGSLSQLTPCFSLPLICLADWLVDRRHCNLKWQSQVLVIREKINAAIQDMPENEEIKQLLAGACEWSLGSGVPRIAEVQAARVGVTTRSLFPRVRLW